MKSEKEYDIVLCYRRHSAQTAKLFKRYLISHRFIGEVWYSDDETYGDFKRDPQYLINNAECVVVFIDPNFTYNFLNDEDPKVECITAKEIVEIIKKCQNDKSFRIVTIYVDRISGLSESETNKIVSLLQKEGVENSLEAVTLLSQRNLVFFSTATDYEDELFASITRKMLPNEYYASHISHGNFYFGSIPTSVDIILWDSVKKLAVENISFDNTSIDIPLYQKIERYRSAEEFEVQNNTMISLVDTKVVLNDETEEKKLSVRYQEIKYHLFYKTLAIWRQVELDRMISEYDWRSDIYQIPNAMGLAFMVITSDGKMLFTRRSNQRRVRPNEYDCSIVEGLKKTGATKSGEAYDIFDALYLENEIKRAFCEEVCSVDSGLNINIYGLVIDKKYGQWNFVGAIETDLTSEEITRLHAMREDTYEENQMLFVNCKNESGSLQKSELAQNLKVFLVDGMWDMALTAVYSALLQIGYSDQQIREMTDM